MLLDQMKALLEQYGVSSVVREQVLALLSSSTQTEVNLISESDDVIDTLVPPDDESDEETDEETDEAEQLRSVAETIKPFEDTVERKDETKSLKFAIGRYDNLGILGHGGMGEVLQVRDRELNRIIALKVIHKEAMTHGVLSSRFTEEAQVVAQLQHPNIVPVHEMGVLPDGRLYFTMKEVKGRPFSAAIKEVHAAVKNNRWQVGETGWTFRRLIDAFHKACQAIAYAHSNGVLHRDLKPENIMLGEYDEVLVVDWGIAKVLGRDEPAKFGEFVQTTRSLSGAYATRFGQVAGTPAYMAPEQARGDIHALDERTDIYALGAILYEILTGLPPYIGSDSRHVIQQVLSGPPRAIQKQTQTVTSLDTVNFESLDDLMIKFDKLSLPSDLVKACQCAMSRERSERFPSVMDFIQILSDWLDGSKKREQALKVVESAMNLTEQRKTLEEQAGHLAKEAEEGLESIPRYENEQVKALWWKKENEARALARRAHALDVLQEQRLQGALTHKPDLEEAHSALAFRYRLEHEAAEGLGDFEESQQAELRLREHAGALPEGHSARIEYFNYLKGVGAVSAVTAETDVQVHLSRFVPHYRRLKLEPVADLGTAPIIEHDLDMGSYLLRLTKPEHHDVLYPIYIGRGEHWHSRDQHDRQHPIFLPKLGMLAPNERFVSAGWFWAGGDDFANGSWVRRKTWVDDFVMSAHPVTNREYIAFLNNLLDDGREEEALSWVPRERASQAAQLGAMIYGRKSDGRFKLVPDADGDLWQLDWPVLMVDWFSASAYAEWYSRKTKQSWRLPTEVEWEKAARGVDGRFFSWGNGFDPSYCIMGESHTKHQEPMPVTKFSYDKSPYGVCGMVGNVRDWTNSPWTIEWGDSVRPVDVEKRVVRGGCWFSTPVYTRLARRVPVRTHNRSVDIGFRLVRKL